MTDTPRYFPASAIPEALLRQIQGYCEGGYLYIPRRQAQRPLVERILRWVPSGLKPARIAAMEDCSVSYVYKVLVAHADALPARATVVDEEADAEAVREAASTARRIAGLKRVARKLLGKGRSASMRGNQHAARHGIYSQRLSADEAAWVAEVRPQLGADGYADLDGLLLALVQFQRAMRVEHLDAMARLGAKIRKVIYADAHRERRSPVKAPREPSPLEILMALAGRGARRRGDEGAWMGQE
jgi:hypothetical protein